jgi:hypothetical protein
MAFRLLHVLDGAPVTTIEAEVNTEIAGEEQYVATLGNPDHRDGFVARSSGTWGNGKVFGQDYCRAAFLPTDKPGRVRMKFTMHIGHLGR